MPLVRRTAVGRRHRPDRVVDRRRRELETSMAIILEREIERAVEQRLTPQRKPAKRTCRALLADVRRSSSRRASPEAGVGVGERRRAHPPVHRRDAHATNGADAGRAGASPPGRLHRAQLPNVPRVERCRAAPASQAGGARAREPKPALPAPQPKAVEPEPAIEPAVPPAPEPVVKVEPPRPASCRAYRLLDESAGRRSPLRQSPDRASSRPRAGSMRKPRREHPRRDPGTSSKWPPSRRPPPERARSADRRRAWSRRPASPKKRRRPPRNGSRSGPSAPRPCDGGDPVPPKPVLYGRGAHAAPRGRRGPRRRRSRRGGASGSRAWRRAWDTVSMKPRSTRPGEIRFNPARRTGPRWTSRPSCAWSSGLRDTRRTLDMRAFICLLAGNDRGPRRGADVREHEPRARCGDRERAQAGGDARKPPSGRRDVRSRWSSPTP